MATTHYDVIIIGTGAGGSTLAYHLASSGKRILVLERGDFLPRERENWDSQAVFGEERYKTTENWYDKDDQPFRPLMHYYVGGNTKMYGAALLRMRETDFGEVRHHGGMSPAWPISYSDLEPYYTKAEQLYHVHGLRGSDPTEPPASAPFPYEPIPHEPRIQQLVDDLMRLGYHPFPLPLGVRVGDDKPYPQAPVHLSMFDGFPDLTEAKADAHVIALQPALVYDNVTLMTNSYVERLETSASGREVSKVHVRRNGATETYEGSIIVSACGAVNSAALMLRSANEQHPNGLANGSDMVGRHYMSHNNATLLAVSREPNPSRFQKTLGMTDFYQASDEWAYPMGLIQMMGKTDLNMLRKGAPPIMPNIALEKMAEHSVDFFLTTSDLPLPENRVTLGSDGSIRLAYTQNNMEAHNRLTAKLKGMLNNIGCENHLLPCSVYLGNKIPIAGVAHQSGTMRFGHDAATSVLDIHCKAHGLDNLYVVDSGFFVSSSAVNPSLTIMANALRVGDHLLERMR